MMLPRLTFNFQQFNLGFFHRKVLKCSNCGTFLRPPSRQLRKLGRDHGALAQMQVLAMSSPLRKGRTAGFWRATSPPGEKEAGGLAHSSAPSHLVATPELQEATMASEAVVRARIDGRLKDEAARVLADMGLTVSDAIRLMLMRVAADKALPFPVKVPNAETIAAMEELERGEGRKFATVADLMADLNADD